MTGMTTTKLLMSLIVALVHTTHAEVTSTEQVVVEADRLPNSATSAPFDLHVLEQEDLRNAPQLRLDDILRTDVPGFSLFRRNSSRTANPTTQGVTLRNFGPSGAGRTLVLLDGIPLNDPFAGYVLWSEVPASALQSVIVQSGGGAGLFGNAALAGTIFLESRAANEMYATTESSVGNEGTYELSLEGGAAKQPVALAVFAERFSTDGYPVIAGSQRGPVDTRASADSNVVSLRGDWQIDASTTFQLQMRCFDDDRNNGTRYTRNSSEGTDESATLTHRLRTQAAELQLRLYAQQRSFSSTFSSIDAARTVETPALDQFDVPANALGGSAVWSVALAQTHQLKVGSDFRSVNGQTNEAFLWNGGTFTALRSAGGSQLFVGTFAQDTWLPCERLTIVGAFRVDHWQLFDGFRRETNLLTGPLRSNSNYPDRSGNEINGRLGARAGVSDALAIRGAVYTGFRVPTLNELYRPFRVGNDVTEANPQLKPEHLIGGEIAAEWQATHALNVATTVFLDRLNDAVGNVTIGVGPGNFTPGGFIPAGGVLRQRQNIDVVEAPGVEMTV